MRSKSSSRTPDLLCSDCEGPQLLRILLYSGFGAKCGAPHFAPLLPNTQILNDFADWLGLRAHTLLSRFSPQSKIVMGGKWFVFTTCAQSLFFPSFFLEP